MPPDGQAMPLDDRYRSLGLSVDALRDFGRSASRASDEQRQHVYTACHKRIRRLEMLPQFPLPDECARVEKCIRQAAGVPAERDVEKSVAEIGPLRLVLTAERGMVASAAVITSTSAFARRGIKTPE